jgi:hypothetical protein
MLPSSLILYRESDAAAGSVDDHGFLAIFTFALLSPADEIGCLSIRANPRRRSTRMRPTNTKSLMTNCPGTTESAGKLSVATAKRQPPQSRTSLSRSAVSPSIINPLTKPALNKAWTARSFSLPAQRRITSLSKRWSNSTEIVR